MSNYWETTGIYLDSIYQKITICMGQVQNGMNVSINIRVDYGWALARYDTYTQTVVSQLILKYCVLDGGNNHHHCDRSMVSCQKGPTRHALRMTDRALLAGYPRDTVLNKLGWPVTSYGAINHGQHRYGQIIARSDAVFQTLGNQLHSNLNVNLFYQYEIWQFEYKSSNQAIYSIRHLLRKFGK